MYPSLSIYIYIPSPFRQDITIFCQTCMSRGPCDNPGLVFRPGDYLGVLSLKHGSQADPRPERWTSPPLESRASCRPWSGVRPALTSWRKYNWDRQLLPETSHPVSCATRRDFVEKEYRHHAHLQHARRDIQTLKYYCPNKLRQLFFF